VTGTEPVWIVGDASHNGEVTLGMVLPNSDHMIRESRAYRCSDVPIFTDTLLAYERDVGVALRGARFALVVSAPTHGENIFIDRMRWVISRQGLNYLFDRPIMIVNDVVATAWGMAASDAKTLHCLSTAEREMFDRKRAGKWIMVLIDEGVGIATLEVQDNGRLKINDSEASHLGFAPSGAAGDNFVSSLRGRFPLTWEEVLTLSSEHVLWREGQGAGPKGPAKWARFVGEFVGDVMVAMCAWNGVILCGSRSKALFLPDLERHFFEGLTHKERYSRKLSAARRLAFPSADMLSGAVAMLSHDHGDPIVIPALPDR